VEWLTEPFSYGFMQRALVAGIFAVVAASAVGTWVVIRRLAFMGDALAHGVVPGIAIALLVGFDAMIGGAIAAIVMIVAIWVVHRTTGLGEDTAIGLLFVGMLALGVVIISRSGGFTVDLVAVLFGDVLGVTRGVLVVQAVAAVATLAGVTLFYRPFLALSFNEEKAELLGMRPRIANLVMLGLVTVAVVASFRAVGALLVFALLVGPPATAMLLVRRVPMVIAVASVVGAAEVALGLLLSFHLDTAAAATVALLSVLVFFVAVALGSISKRALGVRH
jgi:zinc/manganese transport system permease protein/manganese/iron transport system permease protein